MKNILIISYDQDKKIIVAKYRNNATMKYVLKKFTISRAWDIVSILCCVIQNLTVGRYDK